MSAVRTLTTGDQEMLDMVSEQHLLDFNKNIAKEVRLSGSEEELRAFKYVQNELVKMGFQTELLFYDAYISLPGEARLTVRGINYNCITHSMLASVQGLETEIVYVGRGHHGTLRKEEVEGKVLLVDGLAEADVVKNAENHGAAGIIFINGKYTHEMAVSLVWGHPVPESAPLLPKIPAVSVTKDDGERIKADVLKGENGCVLSTAVDTKFVSIPALTAEIQPDGVSGPFALFSGHIDSWHYGAMDNGSANAIMMEVARLFAGKIEKLKRGLRLAFWSGHSHGRYAGSTWYCDTHWEELEENCVIHVNIDSSGGKGSIIQKANCMAETEDLGLDAIEAVTGERLSRQRMFKCADQSFWGTGTPSVLYSMSIQPHTDDPKVKAYFEMLGGENATGLCWWWHTTEDTIEKIDSECLARDAKVYVLLMNRLLNSDIIPINQYKAAYDIEQALIDWQQRAGDHFDMSPVIERVRELKEKLQTFQNLIDQQNVQDRHRLSQINQTIMNISRILVPINYVRGSRFDHDLAIDLPAIPKLAEINQLIITNPESDQYRFIHMSLRRKCNEILFAFKQAIRLLD
jgi:hypothetical protein